MTVSLPDISRRLVLLFSAALMLAAAPVAAWQDVEEDTPQETQSSDAGDTKQEATEPPQDEKKSKLKKAEAAKNLYFFGAKPTLARQQGPAIGKPANILPQPYVPKGSVKVPVAAEAALQPGQSGDAALDQQGGADETVEPDVSTAEKPVNDVQLLPEQNAEQGELQQLAAKEEKKPAGEDALEEGALDRIDPSGMAISGVDPAYGSKLWQGYSRADIITKLQEFGSVSGSASMVRLANKIALAGAVFEDSSDTNEMLALVEARLTLLMQLGNAQGYANLLEALPPGFDWTPLSRHFANAYLLEGKIGDACSLAAEQRETEDDAYWLRMVAFCEATRGNRAAVDFQLGILEEVSDVRSTFYRLIDQILVEAEQPSGTVLPAAVTLSNNLRIDVLEATMARLARVRVPQLAQEAVNPLAVDIMLSLPGVAVDAKAELMGMAVRRGWTNGAMLAAFVRNLAPDAEQEQAALQLITDDDRFTIDAVLAQVASRPAPVPERSAAFQRAWDRGLQNNYSTVAGEGLMLLASDMTPNASGAGVLARAALVAGNSQAASDWFIALRGQSAGSSSAVDGELLALAPIMAVLVPESGVQLTLPLLEHWWNSQSLNEQRYERANLLFTVFEALGAQVDEAAWRWLEDGPVVFAGTAPAPAQWRRFLLAARMGDAPKALSSAFRLLSEGGVATVPASLAGSIVGTLNDMGMATEAKAIATELLISQGL